MCRENVSVYVCACVSAFFVSNQYFYMQFNFNLLLAGHQKLSLAVRPVLNADNLVNHFFDILLSTLSEDMHILKDHT